MATLKAHATSETVTADGIDFPSHAQPRPSPVTCSLSFLAADLVAAVLVQALVLGSEMVFVTGTGALPPVAIPNLFNVTIILGATIAYLAFRGRYTLRTPFWTETSQLFAASGWALSLAFSAAFLNHDILGHVPGLVMIALFPVFATFANALTKAQLVQAGAWRLRTVLVGDGDVSLAVEAALASDPGLGYAVVGRVDPHRLVAARTNSSHLRAVLERYQAGQLLFAVDGDTALQRQLINSALRENIPFAIAPGPAAMPALAWRATRFFSHDVVMLTFRHCMSRTAAADRQKHDGRRGGGHPARPFEPALSRRRHRQSFLQGTDFLCP